MRTRYWDNPEGASSTAVQFRDDTTPMVWMHTNLGWIQVGNSPTDVDEAESFAAKLAQGYGLEERSLRYARYMAGDDNEDDDEERLR